MVQEQNICVNESLRTVYFPAPKGCGSCTTFNSSPALSLIVMVKESIGTPRVSTTVTRKNLYSSVHKQSSSTVEQEKNTITDRNKINKVFTAPKFLFKVYKQYCNL